MMIRKFLSYIFSVNTLYYLLILSCSLPAFILSFTEHYPFFAAIANSFVIFGGVWWLASLTKRIGRTAWLMFPLMFFSAFQIVLLYLYGRSIIAVDMFLNLVTTNSGEVAELLSNLWPAIVAVCVIFIPILTGATICIVRKRYLKESFMKANIPFAITASAIGVVSLIISVCSISRYHIKNDLYPVNVIYNIYLATQRTVATESYHDTSRDFTFHAVDNDTIQMRRVVLLVVGETSRSTNWELCGYDRETNPRLKSKAGLYMSKKALSESNTTHKSVPMLLSHITASTFDSIYNIKSIITAFKEAGYATAFFSNQLRNHSFIDFFGQEADTVSFIRDYEPDGMVASDMHLTESLLDILSKGNNRQLIVLHSYGSHFNYCDRYDKADEKFTPTDYLEASKHYRDKLINAYDNTIVATDRFLARSIEIIDSAAPLASLIYTSDHGEDIFDNNSRYFLHASPLPTIHQVSVPFMVWTSDTFTLQHPEKIQALNRNLDLPLSSSRSYFHTALDLAGISTPVFDPAASWVSESYTPLEPLYLTDHNKAVKLTDIEGIVLTY